VGAGRETGCGGNDREATGTCVREYSSVILHTYLPMKMEQCVPKHWHSKLQTPVNNPEESTQHDKSRLFLYTVLTGHVPFSASKHLLSNSTANFHADRSV
jgi:hypothetical protein